MAIYYGDGTNSGEGRVINTSSASTNSRGSVNVLYGSGYHTLWSPLTINKKSTSSVLHIMAHMIGHGKYSYPYYNTYVYLSHSNANYSTYRGSNYTIGAYIGGGSVIWTVNTLISHANLSSPAAGTNITLEFRYSSANGGNNRPFNIFNPNSSDDNRGAQQGSWVIVNELET
tara:strand:- start:93 stop:608 length:516 start_codon:yes stop_codon:yes gene_type:complete